MSPTADAILIVDDHALMRAGLRRLVEDHPGSGDIVEAADAEAALAAVRHSAFKLILMDISLPGLSGIECSLRILDIDPSARIIILTGMPEPTHANRLLKAGVAGYLTKGCSTEEMHAAMSKVLAGGRYISHVIASELVQDATRGASTQYRGKSSGNFAVDDPADSVRAASDSPFERLSRRELEVVMQLLDGKRNSQIAELLFISEKTVSTHRRSACDKLGIDTIAGLARLAMAHGLWATA